MRTASLLLLLFLLLMLHSGCNGQGAGALKQRNANGSLGGGCDGCELMYEGMPDFIGAADTSEGWNESGRKMLVKGKVYRQDGKTPAGGIILYYWHTDSTGRYTPSQDMSGEVRRHGRMRGWMKTDAEGNYALYTSRPGNYPNENMAAHIHVLVREPDLEKEYWIDEWVFTDDPLLSAEQKNAARNRGGSGILTISKQNGVEVAEHNIILGKNIPGYPEKN